MGIQKSSRGQQVFPRLDLYFWSCPVDRRESQCPKPVAVGQRPLASTGVSQKLNQSESQNQQPRRRVDKDKLN